ARCFGVYDSGAGDGDGAATGGAVDGASVRLAPHSSQNLLPGSACAPHDGHVAGKRVPHSRQNFAPSRLSWPHCGHWIYWRTSVAWSSTCSGMVSLSACAVIMFTTKSKVIGCSNGKSPGLVPL